MIVDQVGGNNSRQITEASEKLEQGSLKYNNLNPQNAVLVVVILGNGTIPSIMKLLEQFVRISSRSECKSKPSQRIPEQ